MEQGGQGGGMVMFGIEAEEDSSEEEEDVRLIRVIHVEWSGGQSSVG